MINIICNPHIWQEQFDIQKKLTLEASAKTINATVLDMYRNIVQRTPVGDPNLWHPPYWPKNYKPGTLKASWNLSFNNMQRDAASGQFASSEQIQGSGGLSFKINSSEKQEVVIYNSQPYAQRVEMGWSSQAPTGMMRVSIAEYTSTLDKNAAKYRIKN